MQNPDATRVAGFGTWLKLRRYVRKGEHGIAIMAPCVYKSKDAESESDSGKNARPIFFKTAYVFDITQTEGEELPAVPAWSSDERRPELENRLAAYAARLGIDYRRTTDDLHGAKGYSAGGLIVLAADTGTKTLIHELAHEILHQAADRAGLDRETKELEAEAVAYIVADHFSLAHESPNYLALWDADAAKLKSRFERIQRAAAQILAAIEPKPAQAEAE
jgi:antirestriction protein ArdC